VLPPPIRMRLLVSLKKRIQGNTDQVVRLCLGQIPHQVARGGCQPPMRRAVPLAWRLQIGLSGWPRRRGVAGKSGTHRGTPKEPGGIRMSNDGDTPREEPGREFILVAIDFSKAARKALFKAISLASSGRAELLVLHVIDQHGLDEVAMLMQVSEDELRDRLEREHRDHLSSLLVEVMGSTEEVPFRPLISWGRPFQQILAKASEFAVDLIVLGNAGRTADLERALFGSTAERVLRGAPCPVLCVPL
jgi:nucleotide-binding universal stress UspA family protein